MGIISDLERIGDQCADIAEMVEHLCGADKHIQPMADLRLMGDTARSMVHDALDSIHRRRRGESQGRHHARRPSSTRRWSG